MQDKVTKTLDKKQVKRLAAVQKKANSLYANKPFAVEFQRLYTLASYLSPILGFLSIAFASLYLYTYTAHFFTLLLGIALLGLFEYLKQVALREALRLWFKKRRFQALPLFAAGFLFLALSVFCAYQGAIAAIKHFENKSISISKNTEAQIHTLKTEERAEILRIDSLKSAYIKANSWKGTLIQKDEHFTALANFDAEKKEITAYNALRIKDLEATAAQERTALADESQNYSPFILGLSLLIEGVILVCAFFIPYYFYKAFEENLEVAEANAWDLPYLLHYIKNAMQTVDFHTFNATKTASVFPTPPLSTANVAEGTTSVGAPIGFYAEPNDKRLEGEKKVVEKVWESGNKACGHCGKLFRYSIHNQKYCSNACRYKANRLKT